MNPVRVLCALVICLALAACDGAAPAATTPTLVPVIVPTPPSPAVTNPTTVLPTRTAVLPIATASPSLEAALSDQQIVDGLKAAGLPIAEVQFYTAETDPNHLLGRPNQYTAKASWHDSRLPAPTDANEIQVSDGGGIEIYPTQEGAELRKKYLDELGKALPVVVEYSYVYGPVLLRVSGTLTPNQAAEYEKAAQDILNKQP